MEDEALFSVISKCFVPLDETDWDELTERDLWNDFLDSACEKMQDAELFESSEGYDVLGVLHDPPTYAEHKTFCARHFVGGLPQSALPIESLYTEWSNDPRSCFGRQKGLYLGDSATYMREVIERMGMSVPYEYSACPDHLALELDLVAVMLRSDSKDEAHQLIVERLGWLPDYRVCLIGIQDDARFYSALVDLLIRIQVQEDRHKQTQMAVERNVSACYREETSCQRRQ
jgi:TorA maturation chaperone TorD